VFLSWFRFACGEEKLSRHTEMDPDLAAAVEIETHILAAADYIFENLAFFFEDAAFDNRGRPDQEVFEPLSRQMFPELRGQGFNFRQFRNGKGPQFTGLKDGRQIIEQRGKSRRKGLFCLQE